MRGVKGGGGGSGKASPQRPSGGRRSISPATPQRAGGDVSASPQPEAPPDYRPYILAAQHENIRRLGRDISFGVSMILNGDYRQVMEEGQRPFDWFTDLP
jgi:hypothetical protein